MFNYLLVMLDEQLFAIELSISSMLVCWLLVNCFVLQEASRWKLNIMLHARTTLQLFISLCIYVLCTIIYGSLINFFFNFLYRSHTHKLFMRS